jgi:hypothetical protein
MALLVPIVIGYEIGIDNTSPDGYDHWQAGLRVWSTPTVTYSSPSYSSQYQNLGSNNLWIETSQGRTLYAVVPQYSAISIVASTSLGGQGVVYELYPITTGNGAYTSNIYSFNPGDNRLGFAADIVGRHILLFSINNQISNGIIVDVQGAVFNSLQQQSNGGLLGRGVGV